MYNRLFNWFTPKSTASRVVLPSTGSVYVVSRISNRYSGDFPPQLAGKMSKSQFLAMMFDINEVLEIYWPCTLCWVFSHLMILLSFGFSILIPLICISRLETELRDLIKYNNRELRKKGLVLELRRKYFSSWLEIQVLASSGEADWEEGGERTRFAGHLVPDEFELRASEEDESSSEDYDMGSDEGSF